MSTVMNRMSRFFGAAPARSAPVDALTALGAVPLDMKTPRTLTADDFTAGAPLAGTRSTLARVVIPRGDLHELDLNRPVRMYLHSRFTVTATSSAGGLYTIDIGAANLRMIRSTRPAPAGAFTTTHPDVIVYAAPTVPGPTVVATVASVDFAAGEINLSGLGDTIGFTFTAYYLPGDGDVQLRAVQPSGLDQRTTVLFGDTLASIHEVDQASGLTAPRLQRSTLTALPLPPQWRLEIEVDTAHAFAWTADARNELQLHGRRTPVALFNARALGQIAGLTLAQG